MSQSRDEYDDSRDARSRRTSRRHQDSAADDWRSRWASLDVTDGDSDSGDLEESEFGREASPRRRTRQHTPQDPMLKTMTDLFVDRFRYGGTVGMRTKTKRIMSMRAVSEADIPKIKKRLKRANLPYNIAMVLFGAVVIGASVVLLSYFGSLAQNDSQMTDITAKYVKSLPVPESAPKSNPVEIPETDMPPVVDFAGLKSVNDEVSSWLRVPGTTIDYPVMTTEVESKYLRKDIHGDRSVPGMLFTDWTNDKDLKDEHIVIYGHHLPWPAMFHDMSLYLEEDGFVESHRRMYYETPETTYVLKVIGIHKAQPEEWMARQTDFGTEQDFQAYLDQRLEANTVYKSEDYNRKSVDKFFTFITCTDSGSARCIVNAIVAEQYPTSYVPLVRAKMQGYVAEDAVAVANANQAQQASEYQEDERNGTITPVA